MTNRDWTPVLSRDGVFYCSPACGGGTFCRREWYDHATAASLALAKRMGPGWTPRVWENLGWHYTVQNGVAEIHVNEDRNAKPINGGFPVRSYTAFFNTAKQFVASAEEPEDAIGFATQDARTTISRISADLDALFDAAKEGAPA